MSLAGLARRLRLDLPKAEQALRDAGLDFGGSRDSLEQIARANGTTPMAAYALIRGTESWPPLIGQSLDDDKCFLQDERDALERSDETEKTKPFA